jgi:hypothetical protein
MIKVYVAGISTNQVGEEIEIRYSLFKDGENLAQVKKYQEYRKPYLVTHFALLALLKDLKKYPKEETEVIIFDPSLYEQLRGTSTSRNNEALKLASRIKGELDKFDYPVNIHDVTGKGQEKLEWNKVLEF